MQKAILKVYLIDSRHPLFSCEIINNVDETLTEFKKLINDKTLETIEFGQVCFKRSLFHHYELKFK